MADGRVPCIQTTAYGIGNRYGKDPFYPQDSHTRREWDAALASAESRSQVNGRRRGWRDKAAYTEGTVHRERFCEEKLKAKYELAVEWVSCKRSR